MIIAVSEEGIEYLRNSSTSISGTADDISDEIKHVLGIVSDNASGIGPHAETIEECLAEIRLALFDISEEIEFVADALNTLADDYQDMVDDDPFADEAYDVDGSTASAPATKKEGKLPDGPLTNRIVNLYGDRYRTDDGENPYAKRNPETGQYEMLPNTEYTLNGYQYKTDGNGDIVSVAGKLIIKEGKRASLSGKVQGMVDGDERGHLIADIFGGSNKAGNLVAMGFDLNRSEYKKLEDKLRAAASEPDPQDVRVLIEINYDDKKRPTDLIVVYSIDNQVEYETFDNPKKKK